MSADDAWRPPEPAATPAPAGPQLLPGLDGAVEVARGSDSIVYRAHQRALGRDVAVKVLQVDEPATVARFRRELELTVRLGRLHPHVVTVLDTGVTGDGRPAIVMEYLERGSLQDVLRASGPLPSADVVRIGAVIADALSFAHDQGVLHRDVKPQNILVLPTSWVLADFGIARLADSGATASVEQFSYRHASPQTLDGLPPTSADDVWSLGSTLFTLLDGRPPFASTDPDDDTALAYLRRVRTEAPRALTRTDLPPGLAELIASCLERDPAGRPASAHEVARELARIEGGAGGWAPAPAATPDAVPSSPAAAESSPPVDAAPSPSVDAVPSPPVDAVASPPTPASEAPVAPVAPAAPAGATPAPPAASALAHTVRPDAGVDGHRPTLDADPTGTVPAPVDDETAAAPAGRRGPLGTLRRRVAAGLLAGAGLGVAAVLLTTNPGAGQPTPSRTPAPTPSTVPTLSPTVSATPVPPVQQAALRPVIVDARGNGTSVALEWTDPSKGKAVFFVTQVGLAQPRVVATFARGVTSGSVEGVDPAASRVCYVVGALADEGAATSAERCLDPSP